MTVTARDIRRYTARAPLARTGGKRRRSGEDISYYLVTVVLIAVEVAGVVRALTLELAQPAELGARGMAWHGAVIDPAATAAAVLLMLFAGAVLLARRAGPIATTRAQAQWWLPLPVGRRGLLIPGLRIRMLAVTGGAFVLSALVFLVLSGFAHPLAGFSGGVSAGCLAALAVTTAAAAQIAGTDGRSLKRIAGAVLVLVPVLLICASAVSAAGGTMPLRWLLALPTGWPIIAAGEGVWAAGVLVLAAVVGVALVFARVDRVTTFELRRSSAAAGRLADAVVTLNATTEASIATSFSRRIRWPVRGAGGGRLRAISALLAAQALAWARRPGRIAELIFWAVLPASVLTIPAANTALVLAAVLLVACFRLIGVTGSVARELAVSPALSLLFPFGAGAERRLVSVLPLAVMLVWWMLCGAVLVLAGAVPVGWTGLALVSAVGLAGASVRRAYRPDPDWTRPMISTPAGGVPTGLLYAVTYGRETVVVTLVPLLVVTVTGAVTSTAFTFQAVFSAIVWLVGTWPRRRS